MKVSKLLVTSLFLAQTVTSQAFAAEQSLLDKALAWVKAQQEAMSAPAQQPVVQKPQAAKPVVQKPIEKVVIPEPKEVESPKTVDTMAHDSDDADQAQAKKAESAEMVEAFETSFAAQSKPAKDVVDPLIKFSFMHTKQDCKVVEPNGLQHKPTYCTMDDSKAATELSGMVNAINAQLETVKDNAATAQVSVAYFSFSNKGVQKKICELSQAGVKVRVFLDAGSTGQIDELVLNSPDCLDKNGKLNVKLSYLGGSTDFGNGGVWRLHHNKFLMIDPGNGEKVTLNFSSGNLSSFGTSLHLDHWVTLQAPSNSNIISAQKCVMKGLEKASQLKDSGNSNGYASLDEAIVRGYIDTRENCFDQYQVLPRASGGYFPSQIRQILQKEQIAPLYSPNDDNSVANAFLDSIKKIPSGGYLYIAIQHFLHGGVKNALLAAASRGVDVRLIMDDDALLGDSEVPGVDQMIADLISYSNGSIQVRLAETNHNAGGNGAMMHNKLAILNGQMTFSGAGHYTSSALKNNWENFYFVTNKGVITNYGKYFNQLWNNSVDINYTKSKGQKPSSAPSKLAPAFLNMIQQ